MRIHAARPAIVLALVLALFVTPSLQSQSLAAARVAVVAQPAGVARDSSAQGSRTPRIVTGVVVGAVAGGIIGGLSARGAETNSPIDGVATAASVAAGALLGALIGGLVGAFWP